MVLAPHGWSSPRPGVIRVESAAALPANSTLRVTASLSSTVQRVIVKTDDERPAQMAGGTAPEKGRPLKLVVGLSVLGIVGFVTIEAFECAHRVQRAGGLRAWWRRPPAGSARADQRKAD